MNESWERRLSAADAARQRERHVRDAAGVLGLVSILVGTWMLSVPWALIVCGVVLMGMSVWGAVRSDRNSARNPE